MPNGILLTYTYDNDSRVTAMTWTLAGNPVGDLEYSYDADSRVIEKTGSFAQTGLPQAVRGNTFNAANEMTAFNGTPQTYDANGNLANDGTNTYSWDARNHLTAIVGPNTASFVYGPDGRRTQKAINGTSTQFLYDGLNPVQEIQNGALSANLITGLGIDEYFQRTDSAGARNYLSDILGAARPHRSTGTTQTLYTYDPFGNTAATGQTSSNPYQFTGRENDGTGLDYYRARYYDPGIARFISQDPMMFGPRVGNSTLTSRTIPQAELIRREKKILNAKKSVKPWRGFTAISLPRRKNPFHLFRTSGAIKSSSAIWKSAMTNSAAATTVPMVGVDRFRSPAHWTNLIKRPRPPPLASPV